MSSLSEVGRKRERASGREREKCCPTITAPRRRFCEFLADFRRVIEVRRSTRRGIRRRVLKYDNSMLDIFWLICLVPRVDAFSLRLIFGLRVHAASGGDEARWNSATFQTGVAVETFFSAGGNLKKKEPLVCGQGLVKFVGDRNLQPGLSLSHRERGAA